ncbi:MAG: ABC transporter permease [Clostridium sp.]|uniref:ABC transporter permease n=2 Tax=Clostridium sp. TaxID=1506 RepID=UPI002FC625A2
MYFKMARENIKRNLRDFWIYFISMTLGVCIFYSFNTLDGQIVLNEEGYNIFFERMIMISSIMALISLGFMVIYTNRYIIKRRNNEFVTYRSLGMGRWDVCKILIYETTITTLISLFAGIVVGVVVSQGINILILSLFQVDINQYVYGVSLSGLIKTIGGFALIHLIALVINGVRICRTTRISSKESREIKDKKSSTKLILSGGVFVISLLLISYSYYILLAMGLTTHNITATLIRPLMVIAEEPRIGYGILAGIVGTVLFFYSLSIIIVNMVGGIDYIKLKSINCFTIKQLGNRMRGSVASLSIVSLMIFVAITIISFAFSYKVSFEREFNNLYPYDVSIEFSDDGTIVENPKEYLNELGYNYGDNEKVMSLSLYNMTKNKATGEKIGSNDIVPNQIHQLGVNFILLSDYNKINKFNGEETIKLGDNEIIAFVRQEEYIKGLTLNSSINLLGKPFKVIEVKNEAIKYTCDYFGGRSVIDIVINDSNINMLRPTCGIVNINYLNAEGGKSYEYFRKLLSRDTNPNIKSDLNVGYLVKSKAKSAINTEKAILIYNAIFIGVVLLIAGMTILSMYQLISGEEDLDKYKTLNQIGVSSDNINRSIVVQIITYFMAPLILGVSHSIAAIYMLKEQLVVYDMEVVKSTVPIIFMTIFIIYGLYITATYVSYKKLVKKNI